MLSLVVPFFTLSSIAGGSLNIKEEEEEEEEWWERAMGEKRGKERGMEGRRGLYERKKKREAEEEEENH